MSEFDSDNSFPALLLGKRGNWALKRSKLMARIIQ